MGQLVGIHSTGRLLGLCPAFCDERLLGEDGENAKAVQPSRRYFRRRCGRVGGHGGVCWSRIEDGGAGSRGMWNFSGFQLWPVLVRKLGSFILRGLETCGLGRSYFKMPIGSWMEGQREWKTEVSQVMVEFCIGDEF